MVLSFAGMTIQWGCKSCQSVGARSRMFPEYLRADLLDKAQQGSGGLSGTSQQGSSQRPDVRKKARRYCRGDSSRAEGLSKGRDTLSAKEEVARPEAFRTIPRVDCGPSPSSPSTGNCGRGPTS